MALQTKTVKKPQPVIQWERPATTKLQTSSVRLGRAFTMIGPGLSAMCLAFLFDSSRINDGLRFACFGFSILLCGVLLCLSSLRSSRKSQLGFLCYLLRRVLVASTLFGTCSIVVVWGSPIDWPLFMTLLSIVVASWFLHKLISRV